MYWVTFLWSWPKVTAVALINTNLYNKVRMFEPSIQSLQNVIAISPSHACYLIRYWIIRFLFFLSWDFECVFKGKQSIGHISGIFPPDMNRKGRASVGHWVDYVTSSFDLTHNLGLGFFKVTFRNSFISGIVGLADTGPTTSPCPYPISTEWHWRFNINVSNGLIWGMGWLILMESSIHDHNIVLRVIVGRWVDVLHSDRVTSDIGVASTYQDLVNVDIYIRKILWTYPIVSLVCSYVKLDKASRYIHFNNC